MSDKAELKVKWEDIVSLIKREYGFIGDIYFMRSNSYERDSQVYDIPEYVIGDVKWKP